MQGMQGLLRLFQMAEEEKGKLIASCVLTVISTAMRLMPFILIYLMVIELLKPAPDPSLVWQLAGWCVGAVLIAFVTMTLSTMLSHMGAFAILYRARIRIAEKLGALPLGYFDVRSTGEVQTAMHDHVQRIELFLAHHLPDVTAAAAVPILTGIVLFAIDWRMALATIAVIPVALVAQSLIFRDYRTWMDKYMRALESLNATVIEYCQGMAVIKAFNQTVASFHKYTDSMEAYRDIEWAWQQEAAPSMTAFITIVAANLVTILPAGAWLYLRGSLDMPTLILFLLLGVGYSQPLLKLWLFSSQLSEILEGERTIQAILEAPPIQEPVSPQRPQRFDVEFEDVSFSYQETQVLHNVSFRVPQNTVMALVGPSGAGKTTIARLMPRFWDVDSGEITIGGVNLEDMATEELMDLVAFVFQDVYLFKETIYENIRLGKSDASEAEVIRAAKLANCHEFIERLPNGYQTIVGERGATLSGGEKQRISIARAVLKDAPIIILDEATVFVDPEIEELIQQAISALIADRTLIVIAHRLRTIVDADQILVVGDGRIVERGQHQELVAEEGLYARMWQAHVTAQGWGLAV